MNAQEKFKFGKKGIADFIIIKVDSLSQFEIYNKTINWINATCKNPEGVIKEKIKYEKVIFKGIKLNALSSRKKYPSKVRYSVEISFYEGSLKFDPTRIEMFVDTDEIGDNKGLWFSIFLESNYWLFNRNGKPNKKAQKDAIDIERVFNDLVSSLKRVLLEKNNTRKPINLK